MASRTLIAIGATYNRLTILFEVLSFTKNRRVFCQCSCGNTTELYHFALTRGTTKSCGCLHSEVATATGKAVFKHLKTNTREYYSWQAMIQRCTNPKNHKFEYYGGRGIEICGAWRNSFSAFYADMGNRPIGTTLDRIDNNGNYEPTNCRWATHTEQRLNQR